MIKIAIAYDFDGTLAKGNIQENSFIPKVGTNKDDFWRKTKETAQENDMDEILSYMYQIVKCADNADIKITKDALKEHGKSVEYFNGVESFFERINKYAKNKNIKIEHFIISSGTKEMLEGTTIAKYFKNIYASSFMYDTYGKPIWPALAINYTTKTQFLFRINKGIYNAWDNTQINKYIPEDERNIDFKHMVYLGDGETDIPAMKLLKDKGGLSIAVYDPEHPKEKIDNVEILVDNERAHFVCEANYEENSSIDLIIKNYIDKIALETQFGKCRAKQPSNDKNEVFKDDDDAKITPEDKINNALKLLEVDKISQNQEDNAIYLKASAYDDYGYQTSFYIWSGKKYIGFAKIAEKNQVENKHTSENLKKEFNKLDENFISKITFKNNNLNKEQQKALKFLLNDISNTKEHDNLEVVQKSLKRN